MRIQKAGEARKILSSQGKNPLHESSFHGNWSFNYSCSAEKSFNCSWQSWQNLNPFLIQLSQASQTWHFLFMLRQFVLEQHSQIILQTITRATHMWCGSLSEQWAARPATQGLCEVETLKGIISWGLAKCARTDAVCQWSLTWPACTLAQLLLSQNQVSQNHEIN